MDLDAARGQEEEPQLEVGYARAGDGMGIAEVQKQGWLVTYPDPSIGLTREDIETIPFGSPEKLAKWEKSIEDQGEGKRIWVAREEGKIIGFSVAEKTPDVHELRAIYVLPTHHGKNVGRALMDTAMTWLGNEREIVVWLFTHNKRATAFYRKYGFSESGKVATLEVNGKQIPDFEMVKKMAKAVETNS
jgi:GNAT superfamily N-acetyltransferase